MRTQDQDKAGGSLSALTEGPIGRELLKLALPMLAGIVVMMGFNMVDTLFVGRLGTTQLAAMAVTFPVVMLVFSVALGLGISTSIAVSRAIGSGSVADARRLATDAMSLAFVLSCIMVVAGLASLDGILHLLEGELATHQHSRAYLRIWFCGLPFVVLPLVGNMAIRATGDTVTPSLVIGISCVINAILDPLLIYGLGPFERMGIAGAAWATVTARAISLVAVLWLLLRRSALLTSPFVDVRIVLASWAMLLRNGIPIALNNLVMPLQTGALTRLCATLGAATIAGFGVASRIESFGMATVFALQAVIGIFVGHNVGAGRWDRVQTSMLMSGRFALVWGGMLFLVLAVAGSSFAAIFDPDASVVATARWYFVLVGITFGLRGVYLVCSAGLNTLNHSADATILTVLHGVCIALPAAWLGQRHFGTPGLFGGIALGNVVGGLATAFWLRLRTRQEIASAEPVKGQ